MHSINELSKENQTAFRDKSNLDLALRPKIEAIRRANTLIRHYFAKDESDLYNYDVIEFIHYNIPWLEQDCRDIISFLGEKTTLIGHPLSWVFDSLKNTCYAALGKCIGENL